MGNIQNLLDKLKHNIQAVNDEAIKKGVDNLQKASDKYHAWENFVTIDLFKKLPHLNIYNKWLTKGEFKLIQEVQDT